MGVHTIVMRKTVRINNRTQQRVLYSFRFFILVYDTLVVRMYRKSTPLTRIRHSLDKFPYGLKSCENITKLLNLVIILHVFRNM